jgi:hypothetical protein
MSREGQEADYRRAVTSCLVACCDVMMLCFLTLCLLLNAGAAGLWSALRCILLGIFVRANSPEDPHASPACFRRNSLI